MDRRAFRSVILLTVAWLTAAGALVEAKPRLFSRKRAASAGRFTLRKAPPIEWRHDLRLAHRQANETGRPILVVFGASWCTYCRKLENETLGTPRLAELVNGSFVPLHLDFEKDRRVAEILEVESLPTCVILSPSADLLGVIDGYVDSAEFSRVLGEALDYQQSLEERAVVAGRRVAR